MKQTLMLMVGAMGCFAPVLVAQDFDFRQLDKIGAHAKSSTNLNLDGDTLKLASGFLGGDNDKDADGVKGLVANMKAMYIREWKFDQPGQYDDRDLEPLRAFVKNWKVILDVREDGESTQIYNRAAADNKIGGFALISAQKTEVSIIYIDGSLGVENLLKLSGSMGIPSLAGVPKSADGKTDKKTTK